MDDFSESSDEEFNQLIKRSGPQGKHKFLSKNAANNAQMALTKSSFGDQVSQSSGLDREAKRRPNEFQ